MMAQYGKKYLRGAIVIFMLVMIVPAFLPLSATTESSNSSLIQHVILIMMENHNYTEIIGSSSAPYINSLAKNYSLASNYFAISHPSLPDYLAITAGSTLGTSSDCFPIGSTSATLCPTLD
jgi:phosphatidylinositol-3-phosphatase